jgi:hypothetical protein
MFKARYAESVAGEVVLVACPVWCVVVVVVLGDGIIILQNVHIVVELALLMLDALPVEECNIQLLLHLLVALVALGLLHHLLVEQERVTYA